MKKSFISALSLMLMSVFIVGCASGVSIDSDHKVGINFAELKTYRWHDKSSAAKDYHGNDILDGRIRAAVDKELQAKGFLLVGSETADFSVNYSVTTQEKTDIRSYDTYSGMSPGFAMGYGRAGYRYGYSIGYSSAPEVRTVHYEEGTFVVDVVDSDDKLIWRGSAEGRLKKNLTVEEKRQGIKDVVEKVMMNYPPEPAQ
ncbi:MAG: DUF4136 domain-containing protein [Cellvibrionaceae bacterium]